MHDRAAGEVECAPLPDETGGGAHRPGLVRRGVGIGPRPVPHHVRDRAVTEGEPDDEEQQHGGELHALHDRAQDQAAGNRGEGRLERDVDQLVQRCVLAERRCHGEALRGGVEGSLEEQAAESADDRVTLGERQRISVDAPQHGDQREAHEHLHQHRQHVLGAHQAAVEQPQRRHRHQQHERGGGEHPGGVALVRHGGVGCPGEGGRECCEHTHRSAHAHGLSRQFTEGRIRSIA